MNQLELRQFIEEKMDEMAKVSGHRLTWQEFRELYARRIQCSRCGLVFGVERLDWTGMYYHPLWECDARLEGDNRPLSELEKEILAKGG